MFLRILLTSVLAFGLVACDAKADKFVEGTHYEVVATEKTSKPQVQEFFSFFCGHCFHFLNLWRSNWRESLPAGVSLEKVHVDFLPAASPEIQQALARAYLVGKDLDQGDKVAGLIFNYIHRQGAKFSNDADIRNLLVVNDIDGAQFDAKFNSLPLLTAVQNMKTQQTKWSENGVFTRGANGTGQWQIQSEPRQTGSRAFCRGFTTIGATTVSQINPWLRLTLKAAATSSLALPTARICRRFACYNRIADFFHFGYKVINL